jgi:DNA primase
MENPRNERNGKKQNQNGRQSYVNFLKKKADITRILDHYSVQNIKTNGIYINGSCPLPTHNGPDKKASFGMKEEDGSSWNGFYKCFKCGSGDLIKFIREMESCSYGDAINILKQFSFDGDMFSIGILEKELEELEDENNIVEKRIPKKTFIPSMYRNDLFIAKYLVKNKKRKFDPDRVCDIITGFSIGMASYRGEERIIVPIAGEDGAWLTFFAQNPKETSDKLFPKNCPTGLILFGLDRFKGKTKRIVLVESVWDCLKVISWGIPCVASFSSSISDSQAELLLKYFEEVYIAFDSDEGGDKGAKRLVEFLFPSTSLFRVDLPDGYDPCDCSRKPFIYALKNAQKIEVELGVS